MAKTITIFLFLLAIFSSTLPNAFSITNNQKPSSIPDTTTTATANPNFKQEDWFLGFPHHLPIPVPVPVIVPIPIHWPSPSTQPPTASGGSSGGGTGGGFQWPPKGWHFTFPPMPSTPSGSGGFQWPPKNWPFPHPPMPSNGGNGFQWPPKSWPHWEFVKPPTAAGSGFPYPWWLHRPTSPPTPA